MTIDVKYKPGMRHELWVRDTGTLEGFHVYLGDHTIDDVFEGETRRYLLYTPANSYKLNVVFGGADGGATAIIRFTTNGKETIAIKKSGKDHDYVIEL